MQKTIYKQSDLGRTIGSASSLDSLSSLIKSRLYWSTVVITESETRSVGRLATYDIANGKGVIPDYVVVRKGSRYALSDINVKDGDMTGRGKEALDAKA